MRHIKFRILTLTVCLFLIFEINAADFTPMKYLSPNENDTSLKVIELSGSYRDMGKEYGEKFKTQISSLYKNYHAKLYKLPSLGFFMQYYYSLIMNWREKEMIEGLSVGTGLTYLQAVEVDLLPLVFMESSIKNVDKNNFPRFYGVHLQNCSFLSVNRVVNNKPDTLVARNMDFSSNMSTLLPYTILTILHPNNGDSSVAMFTWIGAFYGHTVVNNNYLFFEANDAESSVGGMNIFGGGIDLLHRITYAALKSKNLQEAENELTAPPAYLTSAIIGVSTRGYPDISPTSLRIEAPSNTRARAAMTQSNKVNYFTNIYQGTGYKNEHLTLNNCVGSEGINPKHDTPSHACTRYHNIQSWLKTKRFYTLKSLEDFFIKPVDNDGVYQTGKLKKYPVDEISLYSIVGNVDKNIYYFHQYGANNWEKVNLNKLFHLTKERQAAQQKQQ